MATATASNVSEQSPPERIELSTWERFSFGLAHGFCTAWLACFGLAGLYRFGRFFGTVEWLINFKRRRRFANAVHRMTDLRPTGSQLRSFTREHFCTTRCDKLFYLILDRIPESVASTLLTITNQDWLDEAIARGNGAHVALAHHGAHHIAGLLVAEKGYRVAGVRNRGESGIRKFVQQKLEGSGARSGGLRLIFADALPREVYRCFKENYVLGSLLDVTRFHRPNQKFEEVSVFGQKRQFVSGPLRIAIRCVAPAFQGFIVPERNFRYRLELVERLVDPADDNEDAAVADAIQRYARNLERHVRETPALLTRV